MDVVEFDTARLPPEARFQAWATAMPFYDVSTPDPMDFVARIRAWNLSSVIVVDAQLAAIGLARSERHFRRDCRDELVVQLIVSGQLSATIDGRKILARPGDIALHDRRDALSGDLAAGRNIAVSFPRAYLEEVLPDFDLHGVVLRGGMAKVLRAAMRALPDALAAADASAAEVARLLRDLVVAAVRDSSSMGGAARDTALRNRLKRHVAQHIAEPLDVPGICGALGVSRSSLYRALAHEGGIAKFVQMRRLARLHQLLSDPAELRPISTLAGCHGFSDYAHFSRLFRRTFGYSANVLRRSARQDGDRSATPREREAAPQIFNRWEAERG